METDRLRSSRQRPIHHSSRTCVGCRRRDDRSALLRVVAQAGKDQRDGVPVAVLVDPRHRLPGRGAWLHPTPECLDLAVRRKAFGRALHVRAALDLVAVVAYVGPREQTVRVEAGPAVGPAHETESGLRADEHPMSTQR